MLVGKYPGMYLFVDGTFHIKMDSRDMGCKDEKWLRTRSNGVFL
jgi:hypothetical protein